MTPPNLREAHYSPVVLKMKEDSLFTADMDATTCKVASWKFPRALREPANAVDERDAHGVLHQRDVASQIEDKFGDEFTPLNDHGSLSIHSDVLKVFRKLSGD